VLPSLKLFFSPADPPQPNMKSIILWSVLVTSIIATDSNIDLRDIVAETKGPARKFQYVRNELIFMWTG